MYKIYANGQLIHSENLATSKLVVFFPRLSMEVNKAASLEFVIPDDNPRYSIVKPLSTEIKVYDGNTRIFWGRVTKTTRDFYRRKTVHCESELAFLNDVVVRPYTHEGSVENYFKAMLNQYNAIASSSRQLRIGNCTVVDSNDLIVRENNTYPTVWQEINGKLLGKLGGYLIPRYEIENGVEVTYLDYLASAGGQGDQVIRFGKNLLDLEDYIDGTQTYSIIVPLGHVVDTGTSTRLTIKDVNSGNDYITNNSAASLFGKIEKAIQWDDVTEASNLLTKGNQELSRGINFSQTFTISAVDLHLLDVNVDALKLGYNYRVVSAPHGLLNSQNNNTFMLSKCDINLSNPDQSTYVFGKTKTTLTGG